MKRYKHLSKTDRLRLEAYLLDGKKVKEIASIIGVHISTVYREIHRGQYEHLNTDYTTEIRYSPDIAEEHYRKNLHAKGPQLKIGNDHRLAQYIEDRIIEKKFSPRAVLGEIKALGLDFDTTISAATLYSYIDKGIFLRLTNKHLPVKSKRRRQYNKVREAARPPKGESIEKRPSEVDQRETFGHWEMDTVVSARPSRKVLLVLSERLTRIEVIRQLPDKTTGSVLKALDNLERRFGSAFSKVFKTITCDNGTEFADSAGIERSCRGGIRTKVYYCHPYSAYERGTNENINKLIRRFLPKGTSFECLTDEKVAAIEDWVNSYPRGIFGYNSSKTMFQRALKSAFCAT